MINKLDYLRLKKALLKNLKNQRVCIEIRGVISTRIFVEKTRVIVNTHKFILADDDKEFELELFMIKKIKFDDLWRFEMFFDNFSVIVEI